MSTPLDARILPNRSDDGPWNMATDQWMLESVADDPSTPLLRTYQWSVPTLSIGAFQRFEEVTSSPRWSGVPLVRRATGGGAIWHEHELTIAVALPTIHPTARSPRRLYQSIHHTVMEFLRQAGYDAQRRGDVEPLTESTHPFLCFLGSDRDDLVLNGAKIVGGAQRRKGEALLQQSTILLRQSTRTTEIQGLKELGASTSEVPLNIDRWSQQLTVHLSAMLGLNPRFSKFQDKELQRIEVIATTIFRTEAWTKRR